MKYEDINIECTWGDGPDVLLSVGDIQIDLTIEQAKVLASLLASKAEWAERLEDYNFAY